MEMTAGCERSNGGEHPDCITSTGIVEARYCPFCISVVERQRREAERPALHSETPICVADGVNMRCAEVGVMVRMGADRITVGDLFECSKCKRQMIAAFGRTAVERHPSDGVTGTATFARWDAIMGGSRVYSKRDGPLDGDDYELARVLDVLSQAGKAGRAAGDAFRRHILDDEPEPASTGTRDEG